MLPSTGFCRPVPNFSANAPRSSILTDGMMNSAMSYQYFSHNGQVLPIDQAIVPLSNIEYAYGFGVYETIRVSNGSPHFLAEHCQRLMRSAEAIGLEHAFSPPIVTENIVDLIKANKVVSCNLKIMLIGGASKDTANLYIMCLNPLFPDRKLYKTGVHCTTYSHERPFPHAKTLNMLPSYIAYRQAKATGAYDALLINNCGCITEGTRTNFFAIKDRTIFSPPEDEILLGVMRSAVLKVARDNNFTIEEKAIKLSDIQEYDGALLTSTSSKIMPLRSINNHSWESIPPTLQELMKTFDQFLKTI